MNNKTTQLLIVVAVLTVIACGGFYFMLHKIKATNASSQTLKNELVELQIKTLKMESLRQVAISGKDVLTQIQKFIIEAGKEVDVVQKLESLANASGLEYNTDEIAAEEYAQLAAQHKEFLHIKLTTTGSWKNTQRFMSLIENLPYNVKINKLTMTLSDGNGSQDSSQWKTQFDISLVKKKEN